MLLLMLTLLFAEKVELIQPLAGSRTDDFEVQAGGLVLREGEAGAAFGAVRVGKGKRQLSYFLVVKHDIGKAEKSSFTEESTAEKADGESKQTLSLDGRTLDVVYRIRVEAGKKARETLTLNKKPLDLGKGRVLLVDMTATPPRWEQRKADLPAEVSAATKKESAELARKVLASVGKQDKRAKEFIEQSGR